MDIGTTTYLLLIEWDGKAPPTTWYNRLRKLAYRVRTADIADQKGVSPLVRRNVDQGVIFQEGAILSPSESQLRMLAHLAQEMGASAVSLGKLAFSDLTMTESDERVLSRISETLGRRGRPPADQLFTVTCLEELTSWEVTAHGVATCPNCGAALIRVRTGSALRFQDPADPATTALEHWIATRFYLGSFDIPQVALDANPDPEQPPARVGIQAPDAADITYKDEADEKLVKAMLNSPNLERLGRLEMDTALWILDGIYIGRAEFTKTERKEARVAAAALYFESGGRPKFVRLAETKHPDLLDAARVVTPEVTAKTMLTVFGK